MLENSNFYFARGGGEEIYSFRRRQNIFGVWGNIYSWKRRRTISGVGGKIYSTLLWFKSWAASSGQNLQTAFSDFANWPIWIAFKTQDWDFQQKNFFKFEEMAKSRQLHCTIQNLLSMQWVGKVLEKRNIFIFFQIVQMGGLNSALTWTSHSDWEQHG